MNVLTELTDLLATAFRIDRTRMGGDRTLASYGLDSLARVDALLLIEEHFDVDLPDDMTPYRTLADLATLISASPRAAVDR